MARRKQINDRVWKRAVNNLWYGMATALGKAEVRRGTLHLSGAPGDITREPKAREYVYKVLRTRFGQDISELKLLMASGAMLGFLLENRTFFEAIFDTGNPAGADVGEYLFDLVRRRM